MVLLFIKAMLVGLVGFLILGIGNEIIFQFHTHLYDKFVEKEVPQKARWFSFLRDLFKQKKDSQDKENDYQDKEVVRWLSFFESSAYAVAYYLGHPQFIVLWLTVRAIGRWAPKGPKSIVDCKEGISELEKVKRKKAEINLYLVGNLLTILFGVFTALVLHIVWGTSSG